MTLNPALRRLWTLVLVTLLCSGAVRAQMLGDIVDAPSSMSYRGSEVAGKRSLESYQSGPLVAPFTGVAVEAYSADRSLTAQVRFEVGGRWSPWTPAHVSRSAVGDGLVAGFSKADPITASRFEVQFSIQETASVVVRDAGVFDNRFDEDLLPVPDPGLSPLAGAETGTIIPPTLITRQEWGARAFIGTPSPLARPTYDYMTFHHAAGYSATTREEGILQMRAIQDLHQNIRGWSDIGYQFLIDRGGNLYQGRPFMDGSTSLNDLPVLALGAHAGGANTGNIGISLLGCYHPPEGPNCQQVITPEALNTYETLFAFLSERYGVSPSRISGHRDFGLTACPGDNNYALLPQIREDVVRLIETGNAPIANATLSANVSEGGVVVISWDFVADFGVVDYRLERWVDGQGEVIVQGAGAVPSSFADNGVVTTESVSYRLYVRDASGREQRAASLDVTLETPTQSLLSEVFPNPATGVVRMRYFLRTKGDVKLTIHDTLGRTVAELVDEIQDGESWHSQPFDTSSLPSGIYYYRVQVSGFSGVAFEKTQTLVVNH